MSDIAHPYAEYVDTPEWNALERAISELVANNAMKLTSSRSHIVGYLCKALAESRAELAGDGSNARTLLEAKAE